MSEAVSQPKLEPVEDQALLTSEDPPDAAPSPSREIEEATPPVTEREDPEQRIEDSRTRLQYELEQSQYDAMPSNDSPALLFPSSTDEAFTSAHPPAEASTAQEETQVHTSEQPYASTSPREPSSFPQLPPPAPPAHRASSAAVARVANEIRLRSIQVPDMIGLSTGVKSRPEDAMSQDEHLRSEKPTTKKRGKAKTVWFGDVEKAFVRAVHLLPNIGTSRKLFLGQSIQRMDMIAEYIRRQTGESRTVSQVRNHVANVKATSSTSAKLKAALTGYIATPAELDRIDWDALLGADQYFPHTEPRASNPSPSVGVRTYAPIAPAPNSYGSGRPAKVPKLEHDATLSYAMPPPAPVPHPGLTLPSVTPSQGQPVLSPFYPQAYPQVPVAPPFAYCPPPLAPHTAYPPPVAPSTHTSVVHSFLSPLRAFLSASSPGRDHSLVAHTLLEGGITSPSALADLLLLDQNSLDGFLLLSRRTRVGGMQLAWLKKAVAEAREASAQAGVAVTGQGDPRAASGLDPSLDTVPLLNPSDQVLLNSHWTPLRLQVWYGDLDPVLPVQPLPYQHDPYRKSASDGRDGASGSPSTSIRTQDQGWTGTLSRLGLPLKRKRRRTDDVEEQHAQGDPSRPQQDNPLLEHAKGHSKPKRRRSKKSKWNEEHDTALYKAVKLIPNFGSRRYSIDGSAPLDRDGMIVEYVRRQTGRVYFVQQVSKRIKQLDEDAGTPADVKASLYGEIVPQSWLDGTGFHRVLGPDTTLSPAEQQPQREIPPQPPLLTRIGPAKSLGRASPPPLKRRRVE